MKNINNLLLATFLRKKVTYITYIKQDRCKNAKEYPFYLLSFVSYLIKLWIPQSNADS